MLVNSSADSDLMPLNCLCRLAIAAGPEFRGLHVMTNRGTEKLGAQNTTISRHLVPVLGLVVGCLSGAVSRLSFELRVLDGTLVGVSQVLVPGFDGGLRLSDSALVRLTGKVRPCGCLAAGVRGVGLFFDFNLRSFAGCLLDIPRTASDSLRAGLRLGALMHRNV